MPLTGAVTSDEERGDATARHSATQAKKNKHKETEQHRLGRDDHSRNIDSGKHPPGESDSRASHRDGGNSRREEEHRRAHSHAEEAELITTGVDLAVRALSHPTPPPEIRGSKPTSSPEVKKHSHSSRTPPERNPWSGVDLLRKSPSDDPWAVIDPTKKNLDPASPQ